MRQLELLTTAQVAKILKVNIQRVQQLAAEDPPRLKGQKVGRDWVFEEADVLRFKKLKRPVGNPEWIKKGKKK